MWFSGFEYVIDFILSPLNNHKCPMNIRAFYAVLDNMTDDIEDGDVTWKNMGIRSPGFMILAVMK